MKRRYAVILDKEADIIVAHAEIAHAETAAQL